jgi:hypothetical protein
MPPSGIRGTHDITLGSHLCLFYRGPKEFLRVTASFLKAGLAEQELCVWVLPPSLTIPLALKELSHRGINGSLLQAKQQLQVLSAQDWFSDGAFDVEDSLTRLAAVPFLARQLGYASVRTVGGSGLVLSDTYRQAFLRYERKATPIIAELPFIGLCCYASADCIKTDMFDIMSAHPRALLRTHDGWTSI